MTLDEELLRTIVGQFTVQAVACLPLMDILDKLKRDHAHLSYLLFNDPDYLWAYIRCYPEQFTVDRDPRCPDHVWYVSKCKLVAKSDRRRYERELAAGNLRVDDEVPNDEAWDHIQYDEKLEQASITHIAAVFHQVKVKMAESESTIPTYLPTSFLLKTLEMGPLPDSVREYIGNAEEFVCRRVHFFNVFGSQMSMRSIDYVATIRSLAKKLRTQGGGYDLKQLFHHLQSSPYLREVGVRAISMGNDNYQFDDFLMFLHGHRFVFRLRPRDQFVELRRGVVPHILDADVKVVPEYETMRMVSGPADLEQFEEDNKGGFAGKNNAGCSSDNSDVDPKSTDFCYFGPSAYTIHWLNQNFHEMKLPCGKKPDRPGDKFRKSKVMAMVDEWTATAPILTPDVTGFPSQSSIHETDGDSWPALPPSTQHTSNRASQSTSSFSSNQAKISGSDNAWNAGLKTEMDKYPY